MDDRQRVIGATQRGIAATTYADILGADDASIRGYFDSEPPAVLLVNRTNRRRAALAAARLQTIGVPVVIVTEELDPERRG